MEVVQVRMPKGMIKEIDLCVKSKKYTTRSDVVRDALRKQLAYTRLKSMIGSIPNTGDSVEEVREIRKKLSAQEIDLEELNNL